MTGANRPIPFYVATEQRPLTDVERGLVRALVECEAPEYLRQVDRLTVVGRCGCGACPTIFFRSHHPAIRERELASYVGRDKSNGLTGVVLWQEGGNLCQLEFYSLDGHDPWLVPSIESLERL